MWTGCFSFPRNCGAGSPRSDHENQEGLPGTWGQVRNFDTKLVSIGHLFSHSRFVTPGVSRGGGKQKTSSVDVAVDLCKSLCQFSIQSGRRVFFVGTRFDLWIGKRGGFTARVLDSSSDRV
jgi:hypothetical protein